MAPSSMWVRRGLVWFGSVSLAPHRMQDSSLCWFLCPGVSGLILPRNTLPVTHAPVLVPGQVSVTCIYTLLIARLWRVLRHFHLQVRPSSRHALHSRSPLSHLTRHSGPPRAVRSPSRQTSSTVDPLHCIDRPRRISRSCRRRGRPGCRHRQP